MFSEILQCLSWQHLSLLAQLDVQQRSSSHQYRFQHCLQSIVLLFFALYQSLWPFDPATHPWVALDSRTAEALPASPFNNWIPNKFPCASQTIRRVASDVSLPICVRLHRSRLTTGAGSTGSLTLTFGSIGTASTVRFATSPAAITLLQMISNRARHCAPVSQAHLVQSAVRLWSFNA